MKIYQEDRKNPYARAYYRFLGLSHKTEENIKQALRPFDLTHAQLNVLYQLSIIYPEKTNPGDLKKSLLVQNPDLTRLIDRLEMKGFVNRETCSENRRKVDLSISKKGLKVFEQAHKAAKASINNFFEKDLDDKEIVLFYQLLNKIILQ